ncbi:non-ribosomal peptide synthetase [Algicola sagamiensis]|uniref:non-ribosomal peptide synthetase n=1 Tax=Algicola sagamiensis TaxID=163869 RepID=UPI0003607326|nr:non-ribosomal peptide synthetase [Algicola sagamiensis]
MKLDNVQDAYPLSPLQHGILYESLRAPNSGVFVEQFCYQLHGDISEFALEKAWQLLMDHHAILRTGFYWEGLEKPLQVVKKQIEVPWLVLDWREQAQDLEHFLANDVKTGVELDQAPLMRVTLIKTSESDAYLIWTHHHILLDGWCVPMLIQQLIQHYNFYATHPVEQIQPHVSQQRAYRDYIAWINEQDHTKATRFWAAQLQDVKEPTQLISHFPTVTTSSGHYQNKPFVISKRLSQSLIQLAKEARVTLNTVFQAAVAYLLSRYTRSNDVVLGVTVSGRPATLPGVEQMIGLFINSLPARFQFDPAQPLQDWLRDVQAHQQTIEQYSYFSLSDIQTASSQANLLFDTLLVFENFPLDEAALNQKIAGNLTVQTHQVHEQTNFPLTIAVRPGEEIEVRYYFDTSKVALDTLEQFANNLSQLLENMTVQKSLSISQLSLLPPTCSPSIKEHRAPQKTLIAQFEAQVTIRADHIAVSEPIGGTFREVSYTELNLYANQLAHYLHMRQQNHLQEAKSGKPSMMIGLMMSPSIDAYICIIGILKAGCAYVPIDPNYPIERIEFILKDSNVDYIFCDSGSVAIGQDSDQQFLVYSEIKTKLDSYPISNPNHKATPNDLAYMIYTSGSTGQPKGVLVEHQQVSRLFEQTQHWFQFNEQDVWSQFHAIAFDFSVWEIWGAFLHGGRLVAIPHDMARDPSLFYQCICTQHVTVLNQTPGAFQSLIAESKGASLQHYLRYVIFGGEALDTTMLKAWFSKYGDKSPQLINMYGITETTVHVTYAPIDATSLPTGDIGIPIPDLKIQLCDQDKNPLPDGMIGEIYVKGAGVARGYHNRPDLNSERFITMPDGSRYYRSGDLARRSANTGRFDYLGRNDDQVKVRGYRIELGEVAAKLKQHPGIASAFVTIQQDKMGQSSIQAYICPCEQEAPIPYAQVQLQERNTQVADALTHLPNGMSIAQVNAKETHFLYEEIFSEKTYLKHGITMRPGDCIFDVGANIGMFSLFADQQCQHDLTLYAFEPVPVVYELLQANTSLHGLNAILYQCGVGAKHARDTIVHYPEFSILSGRDSDVIEVKQTIQTYTENLRQMQPDIAETLTDQFLESQLAEALETVTFDVDFIALSEVIDQHAISKIDLLKIDVEKCEMDVLSGIRSEHWPLIQQLIIEVHDEKGRLSSVTNILKEQGFVVHIEAPEDLKNTKLYNLYAKRHQRDVQLKSCNQQPRWQSLMLLQKDIELTLQQQLPSFMLPQQYSFLSHLPLTAHGKVDQKQLEQQTHAKNQRPYHPPQTPEHQILVAIWQKILKLEASSQLGIKDSFFELGGHSLLATQLISQIQARFAVKLPLNVLFDHPNIESLAIQIENYRRDPQQTQIVSRPEIEPDPENRFRPFPLTEIQQAYWLGRSQLFELGNVATHGYIEVDCPHLDLSRFKQAWNGVIDRHPMLRMVVLPSGEQQIREQCAPYEIPVTDCRRLSDKHRENEIQKIRHRMSHQMLDVENDQLFEVHATCLTELLTRLHISIDALWGDAWSMRIFINELFARYHQPEKQFPTLTLSFRDYVVAESAWQKSESYQCSLQYWLNRIESIPPAPELPLAKSPASLESPTFQRRAFVLNKQCWQQIQKHANQLGVTPSGILLAAFSEILAYWSKEKQFTLNLTFFHRPQIHPEIHQVIGDFTSLLLLAVDVSQSKSFSEHAQKVQQQLWRDLDHRDVNGITILREIRKRNPGQAINMPIVFTSTLALPKQHANGPQPIGDCVYSITQTPQVWLDHKVTERDGALCLDWDFIPELFPRGMIDDMFEAYCTLLNHLADEHTNWGQKNYRQFLPAEQWVARQLFNQTERTIEPQLLHIPVLTQCQTLEDKPAVISQERTVSYQALGKMASKVGQQLFDMGVRPNQCIGIVMHKGWQQIVSVLGILSSGAVYVPIDPNVPEKRLHQLLGACDIQYVLTQEEYLTYHWPNKTEAFTVEQLTEGAANHSITLTTAQSYRDLAYVIFTSGSTGQPKGVAMDHRSVSNTVQDINQRFFVSEKDTVLALSALNFDLSVYDIFGVLGQGGTLVLPSPEQLREPTHWLDLCHQHHVTIWNSVPALAQMLTDTLTEASVGSQANVTVPSSIRLSLMSGDWIPVDLPSRMQILWPSLQMVSLGGATEAAIWSIYHPIDASKQYTTSIPYGKPLSNQTFHILDENMNACPAWVPGHLYIGGAGLAQFYWQDEQKTELSFIRHPKTQERLYRTGDLGFFHPDGYIQFLGREDSQVKLRGHRIELGEVEWHLKQHGDIKEACVNIFGEGQSQQLIAYIVPFQKQQSENISSPVLVEQGDRIAHKLSQPGIRQDLNAQTSVSLKEQDTDSRTIYLRRQSHRQYALQPISFIRFNHWLNALQGIGIQESLFKYRYPSAGDLYPVQIYLCIQPGRIEGLEGGNYYLHPTANKLIRTSHIPPLHGSMFGPLGSQNRMIYEQAAFALFFIADLDAIQPIYGNKARDFCLLEAGYMGQLLMESGADEMIGLCPIGGIDCSDLLERFDLGHHHELLHLCVGGAITEQQLQTRVTSINKPNPEVYKDYLNSCLPNYMVPKHIIELPSLPLSRNGKIDRGQLPKPDTSHDLARGYTPPSNQIQQLLINLWTEVLNAPAIGVQDNFFDIGGNSVLAVQITAKMKVMFEQDFPLSTLFHHQTIEALATHIDMPTTACTPVLIMRKQGSYTPLFCLPGSGGHAFYLNFLAKNLSHEQPVYAFQPRALEVNEAPEDKIESIAEIYLQQLRTIQPTGPYVLAGHSLGAKVGLEMADQLMHEGEVVQALIIFDGLPFFTGDRHALEWDDLLWLIKLSESALNFHGRSSIDVKEKLAACPEHDRLKLVKQYLISSQFLPENADAQQVSRILSVFKANNMANCSYIEKAVSTIPIQLYLPQSMPYEKQLEAKIAWEKVGPVTLHLAEGNHLTMLSEPHVKILAESVTQVLTNLQPTGERL